MKCRFLTPAHKEFTLAVKYYEHQSEGLGLKFIDEVELAVERILLFPEGR